MEERNIINRLNAITDSLDGGSASATQVIYQELQEFVKIIPSLPFGIIQRLFEVVISILESFFPSNPTDCDERMKDPLNQWVSLLTKLLSASESKLSMIQPKQKRRKTQHGANDFNLNEWNSLKLRTLRKFMVVLKLPLVQVFTPAEREPFLKYITTSVMDLIQNKEKVNWKQPEIKQILLEILSRCIYFGLDAVSSIDQNLRFFDYLAEISAEIVLFVQNDLFAMEVFSRLSKQEINDANHAKNLSEFFKKVAVTASPKMLMSNLIYMRPMLDCPEQLVRSAVLSCIGKSIVYCLQSEDFSDQQTKISAQSLIDIIIIRFRDTSTFVRKKAVQIVIELLDCRYFYAKHPESWLMLFTLVCSRLMDKNQPVRASAIKAMTKFLNQHPFTLHGDEMDIDKVKLISEQVTEDQPEYEKKTIYFTHFLVYLMQLEKSIENLVFLLCSKNKAEVLDTIEFFETASCLKIKGAAKGLNSMWHLIYNITNQDHLKDIQESLMSSFQKIYLSSQSEEQVKGLIKLTYQMNVADKVCVEKILKLCMNEGWVTESVLNTLWMIFSHSNSQIPICQRQGAGLLLSWVSIPEKSILDSCKFLTIIKILSKEQDYMLFQFSCKILQSLIPNQTRLPATSEIFELISNLMITFGKDWYTFSQVAIQTIYKLCQQPTQVLNSVLHKLTPTLEKNSSNSLCMFCFVVGQVAIQQIVYLEEIDSVYRSKQKKQSNSRKSRDSLEKVVAPIEDIFTENILTIRELELLYGPRSLLGFYAPQIVNLAKQTNHKTLKTFAATCVVQLMCVSKHFCKENLDFLLEMLRNLEDPMLVANLMIGLSDVIVSWSAVASDASLPLYASLAKDVPLMIKKNALMVLLHLILNGMVKVKGQLSNLALCLEDEDQRIVGLTNLFFSELATKDHALANNLSDLLSHLLNCSENESTIQRVLRKLFSFLQLAPPREKFLESLLDKLGLRFKNAEDISFCRNLMFCVSLVPMDQSTEPKLRKFMDHFPLWAHKLTDEQTNKHFLDFLSKAEKQIPQSLLLQEVQERISKLKGVEQKKKPKSRKKCMSDED